MTNAQHLTTFKIKNFKRFDHFELHNIRQFNVITGDNNTGKTSLLEALLIENTGYKNGQLLLDPYFSRRLAAVCMYKGMDNAHYFGEDEKEQIRKIFFNNQEKPTTFCLNDQEVTVYSDNYYANDRDTKCGFIPFDTGYTDDLWQVYYGYIEKSTKIKIDIINGLKAMIPDIDNINVSENGGFKHIIVYTTNQDAPTPLYTFGAGTTRLLRILFWIIMHKGKRIMIDELETGIHYSRQLDFFTVMLSMAKQYDVQIFVVTHSKECIEKFLSALKGLKLEDDMQYYTLKELKNGSVKAFDQKISYLLEDIELENEIR